MKKYCVYIMSSPSGILYVGITSNLPKRVYEHKEGLIDGFTQKYKIKALVYYEVYEDVISAIEREKQLKKWRRDKKLWLINKANPQWRDLYGTIIS